jgi:nicotinate-nucleotide pyrophosphorylase (carboxylating)
MDAGADIIMLDNMSTEEMADAIDSIRGRAGDRVIIEASGNVTVERLPELGGLGLDVISSGALTHSATAADISMRM